MIEVDVTMLNLLLSTVLPLAVGVVTKKVASSKVRTVMLLALSTVAAVTVQAINDAGLVTDASVTLAVQNFVVAVAMYFGVWKPTGIAEKVQAKTEKIGVD